MKKNRSPWLHQLRQDRERRALTVDLATDVAIVGGGIAGVASAFYTLKYTNLNVALFERFKPRMALPATMRDRSRAILNAGLQVW